MNDQHVLGLERLLFTSTIFPLANEAFLIGTHMLIIQMLKERNNHEKDITPVHKLAGKASVQEEKITR